MFIFLNHQYQIRYQQIFWKLTNFLQRLPLPYYCSTLIILLISFSSSAQTVTLKAKNRPIIEVIKSIEKQTGYTVFYDAQLLDKNKPVTVTVEHLPLKATLDKLFSDTNYSYEIIAKTIVLKEKPRPAGKEKAKANPINGRVLDEQGQPLAGATIKIKGTDKTTTTSIDGTFSLSDIANDDVIQVSFVGYQVQELTATNNIVVKLKMATADLGDVAVVSTGYQTIPKERATGSFVQIDNTLLNRRVSTNILDRLDGITSGLIFNKIAGPVGIAPTNEKLGINIRGRVTIDDKVSADPLVVLDNFPYEGDINNINPNDIESITILKDAAAASIWGARSGNGVIVITTKKGKFREGLKIDFNSNVTTGMNPDLKYSRNYLNSSDFIDVETYLFNKGQYDVNLGDVNYYPVISPVVELLAKQKANPSNTDILAQINNLRNVDVRDETAKYFYQKSIKQQYSLSLRGGSEKSIYALSVGYDNNRENLIGSGNNRFTINSTNTYRPLKNLELTASVIYTKSKNAVGYQYTSPYPYVSLADENGNPLAVPYGRRTSYLESTAALGFLDWKYRPLQEQEYNDNTTQLSNILLRGSARYSFTSYLNAEIQYQFEQENAKIRGYRDPNSYEARNNVNLYSQRASNGSFTYPFPKGGILYLTDRNLNSNNFRTQLNFNKNFSDKHSVSAIAGTEIREIVNDGNNRILYGYNDNFGTAATNLNYNVAYPVNPSGLGSIVLPSPLGTVTGRTNRYLSYYANGAYIFLDRYTFSLSGRKDGANIFGAKTNDKITPLWSTGLAYDISKESFYNFPLIPYLKFRASYGYNGNVYNASAYLTASYDVSSATGLPTATITSAPNAELRWEKIRNKNLAIDFASRKNRVSGSIELYDKLGKDLIEDALLPTSTGFTSFKGNAATVQTKGLDLILNTININAELKWTTNFLFSYNKDRVISYDTKYTSSYLTANRSNISGPARYGLYINEGKSLFGVYSFKSAGLDPQNGDPMGYLNGVVSKDYTSILNNTKIDDIIYHGSSRPMNFGSFRNTFSYKGFTLSANMTYKFNYFFRRKSTPLVYADVLTNGSINADFTARWQKPGDELITNIPSVVYDFNYNRNTFYQSSETLVEKGDHVRLQDITLAYNFTKNALKKLPFATLEIYSYVNNVGILWRANKFKLDPDVSDYSFAGYNSYPLPRTFSLGIRTTFK